MSVSGIVAQRGITEVLHFTTNRGIVGALDSKALLSRFRLPQDKRLEYVLHVNAANRPEAATFFDKSRNWLDFVNLSLSEINARYFQVSNRWHHDNFVWWGILAFDTEIVAHEGVVFATTNNSYDQCIRNSGEEGLEALFPPVINRKSNGWKAYRGGRGAHLATCEQAEVLYPGAVSTDFLRRVYVSEDDHHDQVMGWLREFAVEGVEVVIDARKFVGAPN